MILVSKYCIEPRVWKGKTYTPLKSSTLQILRNQVSLIFQCARYKSSGLSSSCNLSNNIICGRGNWSSDPMKVCLSYWIKGLQFPYMQLWHFIYLASLAKSELSNRFGLGEKKSQKGKAGNNFKFSTLLVGLYFHTICLFPSKEGVFLFVF